MKIIKKSICNLLDNYTYNNVIDVYLCRVWAELHYELSFVVWFDDFLNIKNFETIKNKLLYKVPK